MKPKRRAIPIDGPREWPRDDKHTFGEVKASFYCATVGCNYTRKAHMLAQPRCPFHQCDLIRGGQKGLRWVKIRRTRKVR